MILMKMKDVKDLGSKTRWSDNINDNDDMKVVNNIKNLDLKVLWFKKILIYLRHLRMSQIKELIIEFESDKKEKWSDLKSKILLLSCALDSVFDNIIMIALSNRMLNDSKFDNAIAIWWFVIINLISAVIIMMLLCYNCISSYISYHSWHVIANRLTFHKRNWHRLRRLINLMNAIIMLNHNDESQSLTMSQCSIISRFQPFLFWSLTMPQCSITSRCPFSLFFVIETTTKLRR